MKRFIMTIGLLAAVSSQIALAGSVTSGVDTTEFSSGTAAMASEMNANFQALINAINDNNSRIAALESGAGGGSSDLLSVISDSTYQVHFMGSTLGHPTVSGVQSWNIQRFGGTLTLTFHADGTLTEVAKEANRLLDLDMECDTQGFCSRYTENGDDPETTYGPGGSWTLNGNVLSIIFPSEGAGATDAEDWTLSGNGQVLMFGNAEFPPEDMSTADTLDEFTSYMAVGARL